MVESSNPGVVARSASGPEEEGLGQESQAVGLGFLGMRLETVFAAGEQELRLRDLSRSVSLERLLPGEGAWEVEIGFGKGRYLLGSALEHPGRRFLGIELVSRYYRMLCHRSRRRGVSNLLLIRGEALYLLSAVLPAGFATRLHVYFPDPWPKSRHHKRRLFDPETLDLVLGVLRPGGELCFATDFIDYGQRVVEILEGYPDLVVEQRDAPWPDGARTHYEAKYMDEGRTILRLSAKLAKGQLQAERLHAEGRAGILTATAVRTRPDS